MKKYNKLGFINSLELFKTALSGGYAIPAYNFNNLEQLQAIIEASVVTNSPVIISITESAIEYIDFSFLPFLARGAVDYAKKLNSGNNFPLVLHLDHGHTPQICYECIKIGFSSVMIDGSMLPYEENIKLTRQVADFAHKHNVSVEGELGILAGFEDNVASENSSYTDPRFVYDFVKKTNIDSLAVSIGTSHGPNKFKPEQCVFKNGEFIPPPLRFDILEKIENEIPGFPIVLHGSSSIPIELVQKTNNNGGSIKNAIGIPEEQLKKAASTSVCKINIDADGRLATTAAIRDFFNNKPEVFNPRDYLGYAKTEMKEVYKYKIINIFGSQGAAVIN